MLLSDVLLIDRRCLLVIDKTKNSSPMCLRLLQLDQEKEKQLLLRRQWFEIDEKKQSLAFVRTRVHVGIYT